jgi:hypothetical protein
MIVVSALQNWASNFNMSKWNIHGASAAYALKHSLLVEMLWSMSSTSMKLSRASSVPNAPSATDMQAQLLPMSDLVKLPPALSYCE